MDKKKGHKMAAGLCLLAALSLASGCGSKAEQETTAASALAEETMTAAETAETETETEAATAETYPGTLAAAEGEEQAYFGVMYASVLDLWQDGEGVNIYSLQDSNDPENVWTLSSLDIGSISTEMEKGSAAAFLFSGEGLKDISGVLQGFPGLIAIVPGPFDHCTDRCLARHGVFRVAVRFCEFVRSVCERGGRRIQFGPELKNFCFFRFQMELMAGERSLEIGNFGFRLAERALPFRQFSAPVLREMVHIRVFERSAQRTGPVLLQRFAKFFQMCDPCLFQRLLFQKGDLLFPGGLQIGFHPEEGVNGVEFLTDSVLEGFRFLNLRAESRRFAVPAELLIQREEGLGKTLFFREEFGDGFPVEQGGEKGFLVPEEFFPVPGCPELGFIAGSQFIKLFSAEGEFALQTLEFRFAVFDFAPDCGQFAAEQFDGGEACGEPGIRGAAFQFVRAKPRDALGFVGSGLLITFNWGL